MQKVLLICTSEVSAYLREILFGSIYVHVPSTLCCSPLMIHSILWLIGSVRGGFDLPAFSHPLHRTSGHVTMEHAFARFIRHGHVMGKRGSLSSQSQSSHGRAALRSQSARLVKYNGVYPLPVLQ